jgi:hypothetical protein
VILHSTSNLLIHRLNYPRLTGGSKFGSGMTAIAHCFRHFDVCVEIYTDHRHFHAAQLPTATERQIPRLPRLPCFPVHAARYGQSSLPHRWLRLWHRANPRPGKKRNNPARRQNASGNEPLDVFFLFQQQGGAEIKTLEGFGNWPQIHEGKDTFRRDGQGFAVFAADTIPFHDGKLRQPFDQMVLRAAGFTVFFQGFDTRAAITRAVEAGRTCTRTP